MTKLDTDNDFGAWHNPNLAPKRHENPRIINPEVSETPIGKVFDKVDQWFHQTATQKEFGWHVLFWTLVICGPIIISRFL